VGGGRAERASDRDEEEAVIYLDWRLFGAAGWRLSALAVDLVILQPAWRGFEAVERLERRIYA
jgi:hypothetical protein